VILLSHPTGNQFVRQAALALHRAGLLGAFWTCVTWDRHSVLNRLMPARLAAQLNRRAYPAELRPLIRRYPWRELGRMAGQITGLNFFNGHERAALSWDAVYRSLDRRVAAAIRRGAAGRAVYAYEDAARETLRAAAERGWARIYDLPIGYWRAAQAMFGEEAEREPEWAVTLTGRFDSPEKLARKDDELRAASVVLAATSFTRRTLELMPGLRAPVRVVPYGAPPVNPREHRPSAAGPLRVLYVGSLTQRKGLAYFLRACDRLGRAVDVTIIGRRAAPGCAPLEEALKRYRWIESLPHHAVLEEMDAHDVLVFPSLFEGFGLVILEAMAQGVPVITTPNTAGPEVIAEGEDGFVVPIRSVDAIVERLELLAADRGRLRDMSVAAKRKAAALTWETYGRGIVEVAREFMAGQVAVPAGQDA
jgi:glycosyltransferase involved in cell wall biosynthesis